MPKIRKRLPSPALVIAVIALVVALGGTAYAVKKLKAGKIIKPNTVTNKVLAADYYAATLEVGCGVNSSSPGITAQQSGNHCNVTFPRNVSGCTILVSPFIAFDSGGEAIYTKLGGAQVRVQRYDSGGGTPTAGAVSVAAICPKGAPA